MRQSIEQTEGQIQKLESQVEQVQTALEGIVYQLYRISEAVSRLESRGDRDTSKALQTNLKEKQDKEKEARREISKLIVELDTIQSQLADTRMQNDQSREEIEALNRIGEDVDSALNEVGERDTNLRFQEQQVRILRERLGRLITSDTSFYEPRSIAPISERIKWVDEGIQPVNVTDIVSPDGIEGPEDFQKVSAIEMQAGINKLQAMQPAIESGTGSTSDYWRAFDREQGLEYVDGYQRIYDAFYGMDAIKVTFDGEKYDIINGRHRIWLAQRMGVENLPMRLSRKTET